MWDIKYLKSVLDEDIPLLDKKVKDIIKSAIEKKLMIDPIHFGKPLRFNLKGHRRLRVGDYRVVYTLDIDIKLVIITVIKHRKDVYEDWLFLI